MAETKAYSGSGYVQKARGKWRNAVYLPSTARPTFAPQIPPGRGVKSPQLFTAYRCGSSPIINRYFFCFSQRAVLATHGLRSIECQNHDKGHASIRG